jgi:hypothetical protein
MLAPLKLTSALQRIRNKFAIALNILREKARTCSNYSYGFKKASFKTYALFSLTLFKHKYHTNGVFAFVSFLTGISAQNLRFLEHSPPLQ